jgi:hypothetical protein
LGDSEPPKDRTEQQRQGCDQQPLGSRELS